MANTIGTAYINIAPNMSGIQGKIAGGLKGSGEQFSAQFSNEISGKSAAIMGAIGGVAAAAMNKAIGVVSGSLKGFIDSASEIQSLRASFQSLTGDVDKTNQVMTSLYDFGKKTAFSNADIQGAGRSFLSVGQNVDQMKESMQLAGDIAGATGADLSQLVLPLSQAYARGTLQTQDFYQILNAGGGALRGTLQQVVASKTGITNLGDAMSQGKVTTDLLWQAMRQATAQGGFAFEGAIKQSETFNGRMSNLKEGLTQVGLKILGVNAQTGEVNKGGLFDQLGTAVQWLTDNLPKLQPQIDTIANGLSKGLQAVVGFIPTLISGFAFFIQHKDIFVPIAITVGIFAGVIKGVLLAQQAWNAAIGAWATITKVATAVQVAFNAVMSANPIGLIVLAIAALVAGLVYFFSQTKTGQQIWAGFVSFLSGVWDQLKTGFAAVGSFFSGVWSGISAGVSAVVGFFQGVWNTISSGVSAFMQFFADHWRIIILIVLGPLGLLIDFVTAYWSEITGAISTALGAIWNVISSVFNAVAGFIGGVFSTIGGIIGGAVSWYWGIITSVFNAIAGFMGAVFGPPINAIVGTFRWLGGMVSSIVGGIWGGITSAFNSVTGFLGGVGGTIGRMFAGAGSWLYNSGRDIINGLVNGASSLLSRIGSMFLDIIPGWIKEPFKKALGIHSPSRVFAGFGVNIGEGLANGIGDTTSTVTDAVGGMADAAVGAMAGTTLATPGAAFNATTASALAPGAAGAAGSTSSTTNDFNGATINLLNADAVRQWFREINSDTQNVGMGLTPNQGAI